MFGHRDAHLLPVRELEVVPIGIGDDRPVADRGPLVVRATHGVAEVARVRDTPVDFVAIKARYKALVKRHHPDANGGDREAEERLKVINEAFTTLKGFFVPQSSPAE